MKTTILLIICLITINLSAQDKSNPFVTSVKIGAEIGLMELDQRPILSHSELSLGYSIVIDFIEYKFNNKFSANLGVGFTNRKYRQFTEKVFVKSIDQPSAREHLLIQNIEIPITGKYYFNKKNKSQFYLLGGTTVYYNLHNESQQELFFSDETVWVFKHPNNLQRTTFSATLGVGFQFDSYIKSNFKVTYLIEPILQINRNQVSFTYGRDATSFISLGIMAGVKF